MASINKAIPNLLDNTNGKIAELPRRTYLDISQGDSSLSQMRVVSFRVSRAGTFWRFLSWLRLILLFSTATLVDKLFGRDNLERQAIRLRRAFERKGGSFIKLGIHLSTRIDFIPWVYSNELSGMSDRMDPFPIKQAIAIIEKSTRKPLTATFEHFDPEPILSTSVACFYQAILLSGEKVITKVRRPGIGEQFMADLRAFDWLITLFEFLTIFRPGITKGIRDEFRELLLEELDFINEARSQDAFRRAAAESRKKFLSAPHVYLELSNEEVIVSEFVSGLWLWELLAAINQGDEAVLTRAHDMNIDPQKVAKRLLWVNAWAWDENLFFHANPSPNNIIICQDSTLNFINFATTGALNRSNRQAIRQILYHTWQQDPLNMARSAMILMEPLPPVDLIELTQEMESYNWQYLYALEAAPESLKWQERTSSIFWLGLIKVARKYGIVIDIQVLRFIRATLLYESVAVQLDPTLDIIRQYRKFYRYRAEQARRRVTKNILDQLDGKNNEQLIIRLDRISHTMEGFFTRIRHSLALPSVNFNTMMSKWSYAFYIFFRFVAHLFGITALGMLVSGFIFIGTNQPINLNSIFHATITSPIYWASILLLIIIDGRTVLFRLDDKEV